MNGGGRMLQDKDFLAMKDVAEMLETEPYVLRFYEKELKLNINRNSIGHRIYTLEDVEMLRKILEMREKGLQLKAIESIIKESDEEAKESYEQLSSVQLTPVPPIESATTIDIADPENEKVKVFMNMITKAVIEGNKVSVSQIKDEVKSEIAQEVNISVQDRINKLQELQDAKNEEYYRKLDETIREVQKMRQEIGQVKEEVEPEKKLPFWKKLFKEKNISLQQGKAREI